MYVIGVTGGSGAGKTIALRALEKLGAFVFECDAIYHGLLATNESMKSEIAARFGGVLIDGTVDRKRLGEVVFNDPSALLELNAITHMYISEEVTRRLSKLKPQKKAVAAIEHITLIENGLYKLCDSTVAIAAPAENRIRRIMSRDNITRSQGFTRIAAQKPDSFYAENCDYVLDNTFDTSIEFEEKCKAFFIGLLEASLHLNDCFA